MKTRALVPAFWLCAIMPGVSTVSACGYFILLDWASLRHWYAHWESLTRSSADVRALAIAEAHQNVFRINVFAEGVWLLLGAILCILGLIGLSTLKRE